MVKVRQGQDSDQVVGGQPIPSKMPLLGRPDEVGHQQQTKGANGHECPSCSIETGVEGKTRDKSSDRLDPPHFLLPSWRLLRILRDPSSKESGVRISRSRRGLPRTGYYTRETRGCYRQVFQPPFHWPASLNQFCSCASNDALCLYVGLCNVLVLQFILVVLVFFAHEELNGDTFQHSSRASSNARGLPW